MLDKYVSRVDAKAGVDVAAKYQGDSGMMLGNR